MLYLLTVEIAVALALAINFMYDYHFYTSDNSYYPVQKTMSIKTENEYERIREYAILAERSVNGLDEKDTSVFESLKKRYDPKNSNIVFRVKDAKGGIIAQNDESFDAKDSCFFKSKNFSADIDEYNNISGTIFLYVRKDMAANDGYRLAAKLIDIARSCKYVIFVVLFILICLSCFQLGILMFSVGKTDETRKYFNVLQKIPFDLMTIVAFLLIGFAVTLILLTSAADIKETSIVLWNTIVLVVEFCVSFIMLVYCLSLAMRIKEGHIFENTLVARLLNKIKKRRLKGQKTKVKVPYVGKALISIGAVMLGDLVTIFYFVYKYKTSETDLLSQFNFLFFAFMQLACVFILGAIFFLIAFNLNSIRESGKKIASGDYENIADSHIMFGDFRAINDDLMSIKDEMIKALEEKSKSQDLRNELITNISHDVKTPLTSIVNYADIIGSGRCSEEEISAYSDIIKKQSDRLKDLLRGLIDVSRISTGNVEVKLEKTNLTLFIMQTLEEFSFKLEDNKLEAVTSFCNDEIIINADGTKLWRIIENIFSNVCKYSKPETKVYIDIKEEGSKAVLSVRNICKTPIAVPAEELLMRFKRNDSSRHTEGHGLGLSISKSFTELQGGEFEINVDGEEFEIKLKFDII